VPGSEPPTSGPPAIVVAYRQHRGCAQALREVCAGIEEEGIQFCTVALEATDAAALAHEAAGRSPLLVGVGVQEGELCVHVAALPADAPVERRTMSSHERACQRHVGHNAARLAKAMPLKGYRDGEETDVLRPREARRGQVARREDNDAQLAVAHGETTNDPEVSKA
jgi:Dehydratase medium subunit